MTPMHACTAGLVASVGALAALVAPFDVAQGMSGSGIVSPLWHVQGEAWGTPATDEATVYFLAKTHEVVALDAGTGQQRWRAHTGEPGLTTSGSTLLVAGDRVVAGDYNVMAFDRRDGALLWRFTPTDGYGPGIYLGTASGDLVFAGSPAGRIYAIDHRTGTPRWSSLIVGDGETTMFGPVTDGVIVAAGYTTFTAPNTGGVVALDAATGRERWRAAFPRPADARIDSGWAGGPVLTEDAVIAVSAEGVVFGFDRETGTVRWTLPPWKAAESRDERSREVPFDVAQGSPERSRGTPRDRDFRPLARTGRHLFVGSLSGDVIAYDLSDRTERWRYSSSLNGSIAFRMVSDERSVYVPYVDGRLVALDSADGRER